MIETSTLDCNIFGKSAGQTILWCLEHLIIITVIPRSILLRWPYRDRQHWTTSSLGDTEIVSAPFTQVTLKRDRIVHIWHRDTNGSNFPSYSRLKCVMSDNIAMPQNVWWVFMHRGSITCFDVAPAWSRSCHCVTQFVSECYRMKSVAQIHYWHQ